MATPCVPFSQCALGDVTAESAALQLLDRGMRGFYGQLVSDVPAMIAIGNAVFASR